jgi:predicted dehydrogenase/threonine dehydrogenase-like Zn-dependent dehydrogenase
MKQLMKSLRSGKTGVLEVPPPLASPGLLRIRAAVSLVSAGTERMVVDFAEKTLLQKARARPDLVRQTLQKAQREGILTTLEALHSRLAQPMSLGYSSAGTVIDVGAGVSQFAPGQRVACAGAGYAVHAEVVAVPKNLVVKIPDNVDFESAAFTTLGAIALHGIRLAEVKLGEAVAVIGLGLLGQLTVQLLKAAGCAVIGLDLQPQRAELARQMGADAVATSPEEFAGHCSQWSKGYGADAVVITADSKSNEPLEVAGKVARDRGLVVLVGVVGLTIPRTIYFGKELVFRISRSYGPGRYDLGYEEKGHDYPIGYVRWTENRNMQAFLALLASGKVNVQPLITHRFPIVEAAKAYELITGKKEEPFLGVLLTYPETADLKGKIVLKEGTLPSPARPDALERVRLGLLGAGSFANNTLLPALKGIANLDLVGIASGAGFSARATGDRFGFAYCASDIQEILADPAINTVAILTRHHLHAPLVISALEAEKHVFVEKPLCLTMAELEAVVAAYEASQKGGPSPEARLTPYVMVGFNRRFAPFILELKRHLARIPGPLMLHYRVNAGYIPQTHWVQDPEQGGGRLLGEGCHFIDLLLYLAGSPVRLVKAYALPDLGRYCQDNLMITMEFTNGSLGALTYVANGNKDLGKEYLEVFGGGLAARMDDYRILDIRHENKRIKRVARLRQDKGHRAEWQVLTDYLTGKGPVPIPFAEAVLSTYTTLAANLSLQQGQPLPLNEE